jgi:CHAD domain-containing protein
MTDEVTPETLLRQQADVFVTNIPRVLEGDSDGVHDARVATRRLRALLPLVVEWHTDSDVERLRRRFRRAGRALGRVREADVRILALERWEARVPHAARSLALVRRTEERRRLQLMRRMVKCLERDGLVRFDSSLVFGRARRAWWASRHRWRVTLRTRVREQARAADEAVRHAAGIYFPNRLHTARIALKKLRYALEIVEATAGRGPTEATRDLKKTQDLLGELHDRHALLAVLAAAQRPAGDDAPTVRDLRDHLDVVVDLLDAEMRELHGAYLARRERMSAVCREAARLPPEAGPPSRLLAAGAVLGAVVLSSRLIVARRVRG